MTTPSTSNGEDFPSVVVGEGGGEGSSNEDDGQNDEAKIDAELADEGSGRPTASDDVDIMVNDDEEMEILVPSKEVAEEESENNDDNGSLQLRAEEFADSDNEEEREGEEEGEEEEEKAKLPSQDDKSTEDMPMDISQDSKRALAMDDGIEYNPEVEDATTTTEETPDNNDGDEAAEHTTTTNNNTPMPVKRLRKPLLFIAIVLVLTVAALFAFGFGAKAARDQRQKNSEEHILLFASDDKDDSTNEVVPILKETKTTTTAEADFKWAIVPGAVPVVAAFDKKNAESEIMFKYNYTGTLSDTKFLNASLYQYDCITAADGDSLRVAETYVDSDSLFTIDVDVKTSTIADSGHYSSVSNKNADIAFCTRIDYYVLYDGELVSVNFHETKTIVTIDLAANFTLADIVLDYTEESNRA